MTRPVLDMIPRRACASLLALSLASLAPTAVRAAPPASAAETTTETTTETPADVPDEATIRAALDDGDLTTARELATARSAADPSPENLVLEAEVWHALADYDNAKRAYAAALEALPEDRSDQREHIQAQLDAIEAESRGTQADEPPSTERERIDRERAERLAALAPKPPPPEIVDEPRPVPITRKWYFWVTLGAIAASAGAIIGIASSSAIDEKKANAAARQPTRPTIIPLGGATLRF